MLRCTNLAPVSVQERNAFDVLLSTAKDRVLPSPVSIIVKNKRKELYKAIINWLKEKKVGWSREHVNQSDMPSLLISQPSFGISALEKEANFGRGQAKQ